MSSIEYNTMIMNSDCFFLMSQNESGDNRVSGSVCALNRGSGSVCAFSGSGCVLTGWIDIKSNMAFQQHILPMKSCADKNNIFYNIACSLFSSTILTILSLWRHTLCFWTVLSPGKFIVSKPNLVSAASDSNTYPFFKFWSALAACFRLMGISYVQRQVASYAS